MVGGLVDTLLPTYLGDGMKNNKKHAKIKSARHSAERTLTKYEYAQMLKNNEDYTNQVEDREKDLNSFFWQGIDPRRRQEFADGGMVAENDNAMSNLPEEGYQKLYPKAPFYSTPLVDSTELD